MSEDVEYRSPSQHKNAVFLVRLSESLQNLIDLQEKERQARKLEIEALKFAHGFELVWNRFIGRLYGFMLGVMFSGGLGVLVWSFKQPEKDRSYLVIGIAAFVMFKAIGSVLKKEKESKANV